MRPLSYMVMADHDRAKSGEWAIGPDRSEYLSSRQKI